MTSVLAPLEKMHSNAKTKARNFALVDRYYDLLKSANDDTDGNDVTMDPLDQEVPVSSFYGDKIKTENIGEMDGNEDETENIPDTPTILGHFSKYLPSDAILNPLTCEINDYNAKNSTNTIDNNIINSGSNNSIPVFTDCNTPALNSKPDLSQIPQSCFMFKSCSTTNSSTPFSSYSQSVSSSSLFSSSQQQQQQQFYPSSTSSVSSSVSSTSAQSDFWSMSPSSSTSSLSSTSSSSSPSLQRRIVSPNTFYTSSTSSLLLSSSPMFSNSISPAPSPYSSSPSSLSSSFSSSSPLLSSTSSLPSMTPKAISETQQKTFISELGDSGCTVISGLPNFLTGNCYTEASNEMMTPSRNQEESLEYTDMDRLADISFYEDLTSMDGKDYPQCDKGYPQCSKASAIKSHMTSPSALEVMVDWMRVDIEHDREELNLSQNPQLWNSLDVCRWVRWVCKKHNIQDISHKVEPLTGDILCAWPSDTFESLYGPPGVNVFKELELWKTVNTYKTTTQSDVTSCLQDPFMESHQLFSSPSSSPAPNHVSSCNQSNTGSQLLFNTTMDNSEDEVFYSEAVVKMEAPSPKSNPTNIGCDIKNKFKGHPFKPRLGRGHKKAITLWQFLLKLLEGEEDHSDCIKWLNKDSRIFKIEDSKKVASLWGKVKSRPAMNYDKLSRSVRQYYRKGIIKKPEQTKRLVYQFCPGVY